MRTRRDWKSESPVADSLPSTSSAVAQPFSQPVISREMAALSSSRKNWTLSALIKYDDHWKIDKLIKDKQMVPNRVLVDQCYTHFASANVLRVLVSHGAPMKPSANIELEPLSHYAVSYVLMGKTLNYKDRKKFLEAIQYLKEEGYPVERTLEYLTMVETPSDHEVYNLLTPPPSRNPSPSLSHSTTTSSVSSPPPEDADDNQKRKRKAPRKASTSKRARYSP